jgi:MOSC domain-containing protein YiiM
MEEKTRRYMPSSTTSTGSVKALPWGMFGENFTTEGLIEDAVNIGDSFHVGSAEV